jgi:MFS family permease
MSASTKPDETRSDAPATVADDEEEEVNPYEPAAGTIWASPLCHPKYRLHRYFTLFFMCCMGFGNYFAYDSPAALQEQITKDMDVSTAQFAQLYAMYSWPNVILCFFGGFLIDRVFGIRWGAILFSVIILLGQVIVAMGALANAFWLMDVGRFVFGIGGESLAVAQNTYAVSWFKDKELNLVFGLQLSLARVGSTVGINVMLPLYNGLASGSLSGHTLLGVTLFSSALTCAFSAVSAVILGLLDKRAERIMRRTGEPVNTEVVRLKDIRDFDLSFWYLAIICVTYYICIFPFVSLGTVFFKRKWAFDETQANGVDSIIYTISAVVCPVFGYLIDLSGKNVLWVFLAAVITLLSHALMAFTMVNPWFGMCLIGVGYSILACALWPMVAFVIPEHQLGTAYGIMQSVQNLGLAVTPIIAGWLVDLRGYIVLQVFFLGAMCGMCSHSSSHLLPSLIIDSSIDFITLCFLSFSPSYFSVHSVHCDSLPER